MKKYRISMITIMVAVLVCFLITMGCSKKAIQQGDVSGAQTAPTASTAGADGSQKVTPVEKPDTKAVQPGEGETKETAPEKTAAVKEAPVADLEDIHFDFDKSVLRPEDREILKGHAGWLMKNADTNVLIEGNCDERGTTEYNLALGERRASEAMKYLVGLGIGKERIAVISYGKERPLDPGHDEAAWAKNRRDHFVIKMK